MSANGPREIATSVSKRRCPACHGSRPTKEAAIRKVHSVAHPRVVVGAHVPTELHACRVNSLWSVAQAVERAASGVPPLHSFQSADLTPPLRSGRPGHAAWHNPTIFYPCVGFSLGSCGS